MSLQGTSTPPNAPSLLVCGLGSHPACQIQYQRVEMVAHAPRSMHPASGDHQEAPRVCQTPCHPVRLPLQPLAKPPLYTADREWWTKSPAAVKPAGVPSHTPGPHVRPLSFLPRGEGAACPMGHAPYLGDLQMVPRDFCLWCTLQLPHCRPPEEPLPFGMASRQCSKPQPLKRQLGHQSAWQGSHCSMQLHGQPTALPQLFPFAPSE